MAAKYPDPIEDASPDSGDSMSLQSNQQAVSAKEILKNCGFSDEEIETIASAYGTNLFQAAENAEQLAKLKLAKDLIFKHLLSDSNTTQKTVQSIITRAVSDSGDKRNPSAVRGSSSQSHNVSGDSRTFSDQRSSSSSSISGQNVDSSFPDPNELDVLVDEADMPYELKEGQFDIFLLFCEDDNVNALKFVRFLEEELNLRVCYIGDNFADQTKQFETLEEAINRSLYTFIFVTDTLIGDTWTKYKHDAALAESIHTNGEFVIPVRASNCKVPFSLQPLTALRIYHIIDDLPDHPMFMDSGESEVPRELSNHAAKQIPFVKNQIVKLVGAKERLKKRRLQMDEEKKQKWKDQEKVRKYEEIVQKQLDNEKAVIEQAVQLQAINERAQQFRQNLEFTVRQEAEKKREMERMRYEQQSDLAGQDVVTTAALLRQLGQHDMADLLIKTQLQNAITGAGIHYHLPAGIDPAALAPRPTVNLQVGQIANMQLGNQNQIVEEAPGATHQILPEQPSGLAQPPQPRLEIMQTPIQENRQSTAVASFSHANVFPEQCQEGNEHDTSDITLGSSMDETSVDPEDNSIVPAGHQSMWKQTVCKSVVPTDTPVVQIPPTSTDPASLGENSDFGSLPFSSTEFSTATGSEGLSSVSEEEVPPGTLLSTSMHNFDSAHVHLDHAPGENLQRNPVVQQEDPLNLTGPPSEQLDETVSVRSMPHNRLNQSTALVTLNQS